MAYEEKARPVSVPHSLTLDSRKKLKLSGITDVESFDENEVRLSTTLGEMTVEGEGLHIEKLTLDSGDLLITGNINCLRYEDAQNIRRGLFSRFSG